MTNNQKIIAVVMSIFLAGTAFYVLSSPGKDSGNMTAVEGAMAEVHYDPGCGCCAQYVPYLKRQGLDVEGIKKSAADVRELKAQYSVPSSEMSCHTSIIEGYVVEGHIPVEAVEKLLAERPDILGIAMGGMPSGSPGMPGRKTETFTIKQINNDGTLSLFMEI